MKTVSVDGYEFRVPKWVALHAVLQGTDGQVIQFVLDLAVPGTDFSPLDADEVLPLVQRVVAAFLLPQSTAT